MPTVDFAPHPNFFIGFGPQFTFNIKGKDSDGDAGKMLDLLLRLGGNANVADTIQLYGYAAPGYSIVMPPQGDNSKGFVLGFHGGAMFDLAPKFFMNAELGYQFGYQKIKEFDYKLNYFQIGVGVGARL
jgi:Outer membrane protein beta-barrel domain